MSKKKEIVLPENPMMPYIEISVKVAKKEKELAEQKTLDFQKYLESEYRHADLSGLMPYCLFCEKRTSDHKCNCDQKTREEETLCAKAYKKLKNKLED